MPTTIKPRDLVRTPSGETGRCVEILPFGYREVELINGARVTLKKTVLYLVRSAPPMPWPDMPLAITAVKSGRRF